MRSSSPTRGIPAHDHRGAPPTAEAPEPDRPGQTPWMVPGTSPPSGGAAIQCGDPTMMGQPRTTGVGFRGGEGGVPHLWWKRRVSSLVWLMMRKGAAPSWYSEKRMVAECSDRLTSTMIPPTCTTRKTDLLRSPLGCCILHIFLVIFFFIWRKKN